MENIVTQPISPEEEITKRIRVGDKDIIESIEVPQNPKEQDFETYLVKSIKAFERVSGVRVSYFETSNKELGILVEFKNGCAKTVLVRNGFLSD